jgi:hypothetical protein
MNGGNFMKASEETTAYWKQQVQTFQESGLSRIAYCEQNQIKIFRLDYWRHKFSKPEETHSGSGWIPVRIKESAGQEKSCGICLKVGRVEIEITRGFDREVLAEVLGVIAPAC